MAKVAPIDLRSQIAIYRQRGWYCVPLRPRSKQPVRADWPNIRIEAHDIRTAFSAKNNMGPVLGEPSGWLIDVDLDCVEAIELADQYLSSTPAVTGRPFRRARTGGTSPSVQRPRYTPIPVTDR